MGGDEKHTISDSRHYFLQKKWLAELKHVPIITQMGKFPGNKVT
jgi:hypothetical protein